MSWRSATAAPTSYRERTYASPHWLVRFPHQRRTTLAREMISRSSPGVVLDYGAGDGELCAELAGERRLDGVDLVAVEPLAEMRDAIIERLSGFPDRVEVVGSSELIPDHSVDVIACLGVLEHLPLAERFSLYAEARRLLADSGVIIIDVPVEVGVSLLVKDLGRRLLKGDPPDYSWPALAAAVAGRPVFDPDRYDPDFAGSFIVRHAGFDHRLFRRELEGRFRIEGVTPTPLSWLPPALGNQEIFYTCRVVDPRPRSDQPTRTAMDLS